MLCYYGAKKERERKRAAASCQMLERFLSKKSKTGEVSSQLNDSSVQNEMQPSLQTTPATDTSPPSTSQESVCNDYDVCQHQETSKVDIGEIFYKAKRLQEFSYAMKTTPVDLDTVVGCYAKLHPRRLQLENLLQ